MEQDNAENGEGGFVPASSSDIWTPRDERPEPAQAAEPAFVEEKGETPAEPKADRPRDEAGRFAPKAEADEAAPPAAKPENPQPTNVPVSALQEERRKRQALERELQELRTRAAPPPAPQQPAAPEVPLQDLMFQDPAAFVQRLHQQQEEALLQTRIATSEAIARQQPDYGDAEQALTAYAQSSPQAAQEVAQALRTHPAPAMWAYQAGKQLLAQQRWQPIMQQHGDPDAWVNAEVERRIAERLAQSPAQTAPSAAPPPSSLANARSAGPRTGAGSWSGAAPASAVWGRR